MREIKFRAWKINGQMAYRGLCDRNWYTDPVAGKQINVAMPSDIRSLEIMQFTGLKDKNGVDIYEGDIVHWGHIEGFTECTPRKAVVKLGPALCFETFNLGKNNHTFHYGSFAYARCIDRAMEVIGNKYQNPELIP